MNPEQGYIVTANNAVVGPDYPYVITREWDYGFRAGRIIEMIENAPEPITAEYIQQIHGDNRNQSAVYMVPLVLEMELEDVRQAVAQELLVGWDYQDHMNLAAPALYNAFWRAVLARTFHDDLPEDYWPSGDDVWFEVMRRLVQQPDSPWWDDQATAQVETRVEIFNLAFADAVSELEEVLGRDPADWRWGDLHTTIFHHQTLGMSGVAPIEAIFNRGPYPTSGGGPIVNATSWNAADPDPLTAYQIVWLPSMRMIVDLSSLADSLSLNTTGQSGHAYHPHYVDQVDLWRNIQYHPMLWERTQVEAAAESHLRLTP